MQHTRRSYMKIISQIVKCCIQPNIINNGILRKYIFKITNEILFKILLGPILFSDFHMWNKAPVKKIYNQYSLLYIIWRIATNNRFPLFLTAKNCSWLIINLFLTTFLSHCIVLWLPELKLRFASSIIFLISPEVETLPSIRF